MQDTVKACDLKEHDIYFAIDCETGYPERRFERKSECFNFCRLNQDYIPVTNNFELIMDW